MPFSSLNPIANNLKSANVTGELKRLGFGALDDPTLITQIAVCIRNHEHFRGVLMAVEPGLRKEAYEALSPKLRFKARPLGDYIFMAAQRADALQLPSYNHETLEVTPYRVPAVSLEPPQTQLEKSCSEAIARDLREDGAKQRLTLACSICTREQIWKVKRRASAYKLAKQEGWTFPTRDTALCPACSKARN